jgi:hypothetical protein
LESQAWNQTLPPLAFSNMPPIEVITTLRGHSRGVRIQLAPLPASWQTDEPRITFTSGEGLRLFEALRLVAVLSNRGVLYNGTSAMLAHHSHGDGCVVPIRLVGRVSDDKTGRPIKTLEVKRVKYKAMEDPRLAASAVPVTTDSGGSFDVTLPVDGYDITYHVGKGGASELFPYDQVLVISASSEGYTTQTHELPIVHNQREYGLQIRMKRSNSSDK